MTRTATEAPPSPLRPRHGAGIRLAQFGDDYSPPEREVVPVTQVLAPKSERCTVSLILLLDESGSISDENWKKQLHATAEALEHPEVVGAIKAVGGIAIMARKFADNAQTITPWIHLKTPEDVHAFANILRSNIPQSNGSTDIGGSVISSLPYFPLSPCRYPREVVDVSTDGGSNELMMKRAKEMAEARGITINGIAIYGSGTSAEAAYKILKENLITQDGFAELTDWAKYAETIRRKLIQEIAGSRGHETQPGKTGKTEHFPAPAEDQMEPLMPAGGLPRLEPIIPIPVR